MTPAALLLDFGGVLAEAPPSRDAPPELVLRVYNLTGGVLTPGEIQRRLTEAAAAYARWRDEDHPDELPQAEVWERFVLGGWPSSAQVRVRGAVKRLSYDWAWRHNWALRPGIPALLSAAAGRGIPMAVVSNTLSGAAHRDFLASAGVGKFFTTQIYSDEVGVRKPNPQMIWLAAGELGVAATDCWFVGDSFQRDVLCARRAEVAKAILMRSRRTAREDPAVWPTPDAIVDDGLGVLGILG
ncbi:HAD family hydrolase [Actinoplanes sp. NPDC049265]|uniref:HAD family hydrolase n=1 Tax=Actinoplanes sp. NPDC049265 TaxID=3363902 RepID=UPI003713EC03